MSSVRRPQWQTVPNSRTGSAKASVSEAVVRTWHRTHVIRGRPKGSSVAFGDEMDIISHIYNIVIYIRTMPGVPDRRV